MSLLLFVVFLQVTMLSECILRHPIQRLQQATRLTGVTLVSGLILSGYSLGSICNFTEVRPVLAAGGRLAHLPEPCTELLETDLGTVIKLLAKLY